MASFTWIGGTLGTWADPAAWAGPGGVPGAADTAIVNVPSSAVPGVPAYVIQGPGTVGTLQATGALILDGSFTIGAMALGASGMLNIGIGSTVQASGITSGGDGGIVVNGGKLVSAGTVAIADLNVRNGATVELADLFLNGGTFVAPDATSILEIGTAGSGVAGTVVVDTGAILSMTNTSPGIVFSTVTLPGLLNNGTVTADSVSPVVINAGTNNGILSGVTIASAFPGSSTFVNNGTIQSGAVTVLRDLTGTGQVVISDFGDLRVGHSVQATIDFSGNFSRLGLLADAFPGAISGGTDLSLTHFADDDFLYLPSPLTGATYTQLSPTDGSLFLATAGGTITLHMVGSYTANPALQFSTAQIVGLSGNQLVPACFATGTRIATPRGAIAVEDLAIGDTVETLSSDGPRRIIWIGHRRIDIARHPKPAEVRPVRIEPGAFADGVPRRALCLSPDHAVFIDGALIPVKHLVNGTTVAVLPVDDITYWHVELDRHEVLLAEGLPAESYLDTGDRSNFANGGDVVTLHPAMRALTWDARACAPLVVTGPEVERARAVLARRARSRPAPRRVRRG